MRAKIFGTLLVACAISAVASVPAGAVVANTPAGRVGYLPLNGQAVARSVPPLRTAPPKGATEPSGKPPLLYSEEEGPVMHSSKAFAIFWVPGGYSLPTGYQAAIEDFLKNVAADSGKSTNVYSVSAQYTDASGKHASYSDSFGGSVIDPHAYPTSGTCSNYSGKEAFTACITDAKLEDEVETVVAEQGWPETGLSAEYYVVLPPHVGSCFTSLGTECFDKQFCAYHSFSEPAGLIYANISYSPGDVVGCGVGEYPNGHVNGNVDDTLSSFSHEANESITDPLLNAWFDKKGFENGDECRNTPLEEDYGDPLGGSEVEETLFNQAIGAGRYYLQQEWSNDTEDCEQRVDPASPAIVGAASVAPGEAASFDGTGSAPGAGGIVSYSWDFGDGSTASGPSASHAFATAGVFTVTLTVRDDGNFAYTTSRQVTVAPPGQSAGSASISTGTIAPTPTARKSLKCRKGTRRAKRHGKAVCVKVKKHRKHH